MSAASLGNGNDRGIVYVPIGDLNAHDGAAGEGDNVAADAGCENVS